MKLRRVAFLPFVVTSLFTMNAGAVISVAQQTSLPRVDAAGNSIAKRPPNLTPEGINRRDCDEDQRIRFPLQLTGLEAAGTFQAWGSLDGVDCASFVYRTGPMQACWLLGTLPLQADVIADVRVRDLLSGAPPFSAVEPSSAPCGAVDLTALSVQFLYFSPGELKVPTQSLTLRFTADTVPPLAPPAPAVEADGNALRVSWPTPAVSVANAEDRVYCTRVDADAATCSASAFDAPPGATPDAVFDDAFACAVVDSTASGGERSATIASSRDQVLVGGATYAFATSSTDIVGNRSALSEPTCATAPNETLNAGGSDGCSASPSEKGAPLGTLLAAFMAAALVIRRRRASS